MSYDIPIKVDPSGALPAIERVGDALGGVEERAKKAGSTGTKAADDIGKANERARGPVEAHAKAHGGLHAEIQREAAMLERIQGPQRRFNEELKVADRLLDRGQINAAEYAMEVTRLNRALQSSLPTFEEFNRKASDAAKAANTISLPDLPTRGGGVGTSGGGRLANAASAAAGGLGINLGMFTGAGAIAAGVGLMKELIDHQTELHDRNVRLENVMQKFESRGRSMNTMLSDQIALSKELRISADESVGAYNAIGEATENLFLTQKEHIQLTKTLGQVMKLEGKPIAEVEQLMGTLAYAFESGSITGGELKRIMKEFPPVADAMTEALGKSRSELARTGIEGAANIRKGLIDPFLDAKGAAAEVDKAFKKLKLSSSEAATQMTRDVLESTSKRYTDYRDASTADQPKWLADANKPQQIRESIKRSTEQMADANEKLTLSHQKLNKVLEQSNEDMRRIAEAMKDYNSWNQKAHRSLEDLINTGAKGLFGQAGFDDPWSDGSMMPGGWRLEKTLQGIKEIRNEFESFYKALKGPETTYIQNLGFLDSLYKQGRISAGTYNEELQKLLATTRALASIETPNFSKVGAQKIGGVEVSVGYDAAPSAIAGVGGAIPSLASMGVTGPPTMDPTAINAAWESIKKVNEENMRGVSLTRQWNRELEEWHQTLEGGVSKGLASLKEEITDVGSVAENALTNAFRNAEDALVQFITTGKFEFKSLVDSMLADMTRLLIRQGISAIIGGLGGGSGGGLGYLFGGNKAFGGDYQVPGSGGPDSQRVMFNLTPGERVHFTPPGGSSSSSERAVPSLPPVVKVINQIDSRELTSAMDSPDGERVILNIMRRHMPAIRGSSGR